MNKEQIQVYNQIIDFLGDKKEKLFQLDGAGGCGKTFTISELLNDLYGYETIICTPTHKALHVLQHSMKIKNPKSTLVFKTIDSWFGAIIDYDEKGNEKMDYTFDISIPSDEYDDTNQKKGYKRIKSWNFDLVIIDEVSMVNQLHYTIIFDIIMVKNPKLKIITLGDICQLPPVQPEGFYKNIYIPFCNEKSLKPLPNNTESSYFYSKPINATLYKNMRCENPVHNEVLNSIRKYIIEEYKPFQTEIQKLINTTEHTYFDEFINLFCDDFKKGINVIMLNQKGNPQIDKSPNLIKVSELNNIIRKKLFSNSNEEFNTGEQVIWNKNIYYNSIPIFTNGQVSVLSNVDIIEDFELPIFEIPPGDHNLSFTEEENNWLEENQNYDVYKINVNYNSNNGLQEYIAYKIKNDKKKWNNFIYKLKQLLVSKTRLINKNDRKIIFTDYYEYIRKYDLPINTYYATTINSSQGSTFEKVYVNHENFTWFINKDKIKYLKLLYTSFSRTKTNVVWSKKK